MIAPTVLPLVGIVEDLPASTYHGLKDRLSKHQLDELRINPARFRYRMDNPRPRTHDMLVGDALHACVLEPHRWQAQFAVEPSDAPSRPTARQINAKKPSADTLAAIDWWREFDAKNAGKEILSASDFAAVQAWAEAISKHSEANALLQATTRREVTGFWTHHDVPCKGRADLIHPDGWILDIKTTVSAGHEAFRRQAWNLRYHVQAAWYLDGFELAESKRCKGFGWILVEKEPPYDVAVRVAGPDLVERGRKAYRRDIAKLLWCIAEDRWEAYAGIDMVEAPPWAGDEE